MQVEEAAKGLVLVWEAGVESLHFTEGVEEVTEAGKGGPVIEATNCEAVANERLVSEKSAPSTSQLMVEVGKAGRSVLSMSRQELSGFRSEIEW